MDDLKELLTIVAVVWAIFLGVSLAVLVVISTIGRYDCAAYSDATGIKTKFAATTCYVNSDGKFIPYQEYTNKDVGNKIIIR